MKAVSWSRYFIFFALAAAGCAADLASKEAIFRRLGIPAKEPIWVWKGALSLTTSLNEGALFGVGQGQVWLFATLSVVAALAIVYWLFVAGAAEDRLLVAALGCVMAGILGNLYDRLGWHGLTWRNVPHHADGEAVHAVRDWLHFKIDNVIDWPVFNLADSFLVCGAALLIWHAFRAQPPSPGESAATDGPGEPAPRGATESGPSARRDKI